MTHTPQITLGAWNIEATNPEKLAQFWSQFLGAEISSYAGMAYLPTVGAHGVPMMFMPLTDARPARQIAHLDLTVEYGQRAPEAQRALTLGATHKWDVLDEHPHVQWSTLTDPEGNFFCIAEHPPHD